MRESNKDILDYKAIGERLKARRFDMFLNIKELSELSNIDEASISNIERGTKRIGLTTLVQLSKALCMSTDEILFGVKHTLYTSNKYETKMYNLACKFKDLYEERNKL